MAKVRSYSPTRLCSLPYMLYQDDHEILIVMDSSKTFFPRSAALYKLRL